MADISRLSRLLNGIQRQVALSENTLVVDNLKIKMGSGDDANHATFVAASPFTAARTITMGDANVDLRDIALNTASRHAAVTLNAGGATQDTLTLTGQELTVSLATTSSHGAMSSADKTKLDGLSSSDIANLQGALGAATEATIAYSSNNYITDGVDLVNSLSALDAQVGTNATDITSKLSLSGGTMSGAIAMGSNQITGLANGTLASDAVNKGQLDAVQSLIQNFEWQTSAKDYIVDNTLTPPTEVSGDRYVLSHDGGAPNAAWDGAAAGDIVEFNGTSWVAVTPTLGSFISIDDEPNVLYYWGGAAWSTKSFEATTASGLLEKTGFDIAFATSTAGNFIVYNGSGVATSVNMSGEASLTASGSVILSNAAVISKVLTGFTSAPGTVTATDSILSALQKIDANASAAQTNISNHISDPLDAHAASAISYAGGDLAGSDVEAALDDAGSRILALETEGASAESMTEVMTAGEAFTAAAAAAGLFAVRMRKAADVGGTDGRVYKADIDASSADNFYVIGIANPDVSKVDGETMDVVKAGLLTKNTHGLTVGEPVYLGSSGVLTQTAPSAADQAVVKLGIVRDANTIEVQIQVMGVN